MNNQNTNTQLEYDKTRRKWVSQMTETEVTVLTETIKNYNGFKLTGHAIDEMRADHVTMQEVATVLKSGKVLEANRVYLYDVCVMLRKNVGYRSIAVVVSMLSGKVKTVFANEMDADKRTPIMSNYIWTESLENLNSISQNNLSRLK